MLVVFKACYHRYSCPSIAITTLNLPVFVAHIARNALDVSDIEVSKKGNLIELSKIIGPFSSTSTITSTTVLKRWNL